MKIYGGNRLNRQTLYLPNSDVYDYKLRFAQSDGFFAGPPTSDCPVKKIDGTPVAISFSGWTGLTKCPEIDWSRITYIISGVFANCYMLQEVNFKNLSPSLFMPSLFSGCYNLKKITGIKFDENKTGQAPPVYGSTFYQCNSLEDIEFEGKFGDSVDLSACPLSDDTLLRLLDGLSTIHTATISLNAVTGVGSRYVAKVDGEWKFVDPTWSGSMVYSYAGYITDVLGWQLSII